MIQEVESVVLDVRRAVERDTRDRRICSRFLVLTVILEQKSSLVCNWKCP